MRHIQMNIAILAILAAIIVVAAVAPPSYGALSLTAKSAVETALERNPDVHAAREKVNEMESSVSYAISQIFPTISAVASGSYQKNAANSTSSLFGGEPYNQYSAQLQFTQPLTFYPGGAVTSGLAIAKKDHEIAQFSLQIIERDLTLSVLQAFYTVLLNERLLQILKQAEQGHQQSLATAEHYFKIGRGEWIDVLQVKTQVALLSPKISQAANQKQVAAAQLATLLRETHEGQLQVQGKLDIAADPGVALKEKLRNQKKSELPEVARDALILKQFEDKRDFQLSSHYPQLNLTGNIGRSAFAKTDLLNSYSTSWALSVQLTVPLFSGLSSVQERKVLAAQRNELQAADDKLLDQVALNRFQTQKDLEVAEQILNASQQASLLANQSLKEAQKKFKLHTIDFLKLLTSEQNFLDAEFSYSQAKFNYIIALAKYFTASGLSLKELLEIL